MITAAIFLMLALINRFSRVSIRREEKYLVKRPELSKAECEELTDLVLDARKYCSGEQ